MEKLDIAKARSALELTQVEFGKLVGVHWTSVSAWETGRTRPHKHTCRYIETLIKDRGLEPSEYMVELPDDSRSDAAE